MMELVKVRVAPGRSGDEYDECGFLVDVTYERITLAADTKPDAQRWQIEWKVIDKAEYMDVTEELERPED